MPSTSRMHINAYFICNPCKFSHCERSRTMLTPGLFSNHHTVRQAQTSFAPSQTICSSLMPKHTKHFLVATPHSQHRSLREEVIASYNVRDLHLRHMRRAATRTRLPQQCCKTGAAWATTGLRRGSLHLRMLYMYPLVCQCRGLARAYEAFVFLRSKALATGGFERLQHSRNVGGRNI